MVMPGERTLVPEFIIYPIFFTGIIANFRTLAGADILVGTGNNNIHHFHKIVGADLRVCLAKHPSGWATTAQLEERFAESAARRVTPTCVSGDF
jgi:hypothetical protein